MLEGPQHLIQGFPIRKILYVAVQPWRLKLTGCLVEKRNFHVWRVREASFWMQRRYVVGSIWGGHDLKKENRVAVDKVSTHAFQEYWTFWHFQERHRPYTTCVTLTLPA